MAVVGSNKLHGPRLLDGPQDDRSWVQMLARLTVWTSTSVGGNGGGGGASQVPCCDIFGLSLFVQ